MPDDERPPDTNAEVAAEEALARELAELGPLMLRQHQAEAAQPDARFARDLRARLVMAGSSAPDPQFARNLRERLVTGGRPRPAATTRRLSSRAVLWAGVAAAALLGALIAVIVVLYQSQGGRTSSIASGRTTATATRFMIVAPRRGSALVLPRPGLADLTRGYPAPPGVVGGGGGSAGEVLPTQNPFEDGLVPAPYYGPLHLSARGLAAGATMAPAYRLGRRFDAPRVTALAHGLGIRAPGKRIPDTNNAWIVAADGSGVPSATVPLHSLAVSMVTGEMIYYNLSYQESTNGLRGVSRASAIARARAWVTLLGWPGQAMPLQSANGHETGSGLWVVRLGWPGVGPTNIAAATMTVVPGGHVSEALLWPPVAQQYSVPAIDSAAALSLLQHGKIPLAVTETGPPFVPTPAGGQGTVRSVTIEQVFTGDRYGTLFLVPAYRFAGTAHLQAHGDHSSANAINATWYALVPLSSR